jgi:benzylsuccinate CoA-transferase BbsF subunit
MTETERLPLDGVRVADFGWVINAPQTTLWLAAMGAEVIKVESRVYPDIMRVMPTGGPADGIAGLERNATYHWLNYGKKACTINLATERGRELAHELIRQSDLVVESYKAADISKFKLDWETVHSLNPQAVLLSISLVGRTGPTRGWVGWGPMANGFNGFVHASGWPGGPPRQISVGWPDFQVGNVLGFLALAALWRARRTGEGEWIESGMSEVVASMLPEWFIDYSMNQRDNGRIGNDDDVAAPHGTYPCTGADEWIAIAVTDDAEWRGLCRTLGEPEWCQSPGYGSQLGRWRNRKALDTDVASATVSREKYELFHSLQSYGVPAAPVVKVPEFVTEPQLVARNYFWEMNHPEVGRRQVAGIPVQMSRVGAYRYTTPPVLGQDNAYVYSEILGLSDSEIADLQDARVLF